MKKISLFLAALMLLSLLAGCGQAEETPDTTSPAVFVTIPTLEGGAAEVDTTDMTFYELDSGISYYGPGSMKESKTDAMTAYMDSGFFLFMVIEETKDTSALGDASLEDYGKLLTDRNNLDPCTVDRYGNLATCYVADSITGDRDFFYYVTVHETAESFFLVQFVCPGEVADKHVDSMAQWSSTFSYTKPAEE